MNDDEYRDWVNGWSEATVQLDSAPTPSSRRDRRVNLMPFLDGSYVPPFPEVGGKRAGDEAQLLYPGRWHTMIAPTTAGKSWWAIWHVVQEMRAGHTVVYAHFEEASPGGTLERIRLMAPDLSVEVIVKLFIWLDCTSRWTPAEWATSLPREATVLILDGINACCGQHSWDVNLPDTVGKYRTAFVTPATLNGTAVLSLGHPPKSPDRQKERHGFGSSAWLDEVDGVGFRLTSAKDSPIRRSEHGYSNVYSVKDRYGQVERYGRLQGDGASEAWFYLGALHVDSRPHPDARNDAGALLPDVTVTVTTPATAETPKESPTDRLADAVLKLMCALPDRSFTTKTSLEEKLRGADIQFKATDLTGALSKLDARGLITWPETAPRTARPGKVTDLGWQWAQDRGSV